MMRPLAAALCLVLAGSPVHAEILPQPGTVNPRLQTVRWHPGETVLLTMLPSSGLTVMLEPGERIGRVEVSDAGAWRVRISSEQDSLQIDPQEGAPPATMTVSTDRRAYRFGLRTDEGLTAAYLVRFEFGPPTPTSIAPPMPSMPHAIPIPAHAAATWKLRGDVAVRPVSVSDDGMKTTILFGADQPLPAVFSLGATGGEEVVNGQMRGGAYVIDRVHDELVFRIDRERATARREKQRR